MISLISLCSREFENICKILYSERCPGDLADETVKLFYDHTFQIGEGGRKYDRYSLRSKKSLRSIGKTHIKTYIFFSGRTTKVLPSLH